MEIDGEIFAGTNSGVFQLSGYDWVERNGGLTNLNVTALISVGDICLLVHLKVVLEVFTFLLTMVEIGHFQNLKPGLHLFSL